MTIKSKGAYTNSDITITDLSTGVKTLFTLSRDRGETQVVDGVWTGYYRPGQLRLNPVSMTKIRASGGSFTVETKPTVYLRPAMKVVGPMTSRYNNTDYAASVGTWSNASANKALLMARKKAHGVDADVALMLAESRETLMMLVNPLKGIRKMLTNFLGKKKKITNKKDLAGLWMEYRYGIRLTVKDAEDIIDAFYRKVHRNNDILRRHKSHICTLDTTITTNAGWLPVATSPCTVEGLWVKEVSTKEWYSVTQFFRTYGDAGCRYGFDASHLLSLAWELVPYSFVVDWALGIGSWLEAISPSAGTTFLDYSVSRKRTIVTKRWITAVRIPNYSGPQTAYMTTDGVESSTVKEFYERRVGASTDPVYPATGPLLNWARSVDSLSMIIQTMPHKAGRISR